MVKLFMDYVIANRFAFGVSFLWILGLSVGSILRRLERLLLKLLGSKSVEVEQRLRAKKIIIFFE